jgi:8-oxo-dGTP diphosphatase
MDYPKHIVATGSLIENKNNQILLVQTDRRGWEIPGGQVEEGEDVLSALKREVLEEAGVTIKIEKLAAFYSSIREPSKVIIDFISEYVDGIVKSDHETIDANWFPRENATSNIENEPTIYRVKWLLKKSDKIRFASYSKSPFRIIEEKYL